MKEELNDLQWVEHFYSQFMGFIINDSCYPQFDDFLANVKAFTKLVAE